MVNKKTKKQPARKGPATAKPKKASPTRNREEDEEVLSESSPTNSSYCPSTEMPNSGAPRSEYADWEMEQKKLPKDLIAMVKEVMKADSFRKTTTASSLPRRSSADEADFRPTKKGLPADALPRKLQGEIKRLAMETKDDGPRQSSIEDEVGSWSSDAAKKAKRKGPAKKKGQGKKPKKTQVKAKSLERGKGNAAAAKPKALAAKQKSPASSPKAKRQQKKRRSSSSSFSFSQGYTDESSTIPPNLLGGDVARPRGTVLMKKPSDTKVLTWGEISSVEEVTMAAGDPDRKVETASGPGPEGAGTISKRDKITAMIKERENRTPSSRTDGTATAKVKIDGHEDLDYRKVGLIRLYSVLLLSALLALFLVARGGVSWAMLWGNSGYGTSVQMPAWGGCDVSGSKICIKDLGFTWMVASIFLHVLTACFPPVKQPEQS